MPAISDYAEKAMLDWILLGATPTRPAVIGVGLSTATPAASAGSEIGTGSGYARQTCTFGAAASPAGSSTNINAMTFGPFSSACTIQGLQVWDTLAATVGNEIFYGQLATPRTLGVGDSVVFNAASLVITIT